MLSYVMYAKYFTNCAFIWYRLPGKTTTATEQEDCDIIISIVRPTLVDDDSLMKPISGQQVGCINTINSRCTERPKGEEKFTFIPPEINIISNCFWCNFDEFPTICGGINAIKNIDLGWNFQFYTEKIPAVIAK